MKIFQTVRRHYANVGISSSPHLAQYNLFNYKISFVNFGFLLYACLFPSHFLYIFRVADGFMDYMECIAATSASIILFVSFAAIVFRKAKLFDCIDNIELLINTRCKYPESEALFVKANRQVERFCEIIFMVVMKVALQFVMLPKGIASLCVYFITDLGSDSFQLPFPMWFPFDTTNPIGYLVAFSIEYIILGYEFFIAACTLGLAIGAFWFATSATKEFQRFSPILNEKAQTNQSDELKMIFTELIDAHGIVKQMADNFSDIIQPIIMLLFTWSLFSISCGMLLIQMEIWHHGNVMSVLLNANINGLIGLTLVFVVCEIGQRLTDSFDKLDFTMHQIDWYLFPSDIKRMFPMILAITQQPVSMECFGSIIINRAYSYFSVFRQLGD